MAESDYPIFRTKKRKIEEENELDDPLLTFPLAENLFPDSQPIEGKTVASEIFDLTLVELEKEKNEALVVLKKVELQFVTDLLHKCDKNMCDRLYLPRVSNSLTVRIKVTITRVKIIGKMLP